MVPPRDDPTIGDNEVLWRRVPPTPKYIVLDENTGLHKLSSAAFRDADMSVVLASEAVTLDSIRQGHEGFGVVAITAGLARALRQGMVRDPVEGEPAHALVVGEKPGSVRRALAKVARWTHRPPGYDEHSLPDPPADLG